MADPMAVPATLVKARWVGGNGKEGSAGLWFLSDSEPSLAQLLAAANAMATSQGTAFSGNSWISSVGSTWTVQLGSAQLWNYNGVETNLPNGSTLEEIEPVSPLILSDIATAAGTLATGTEDNGDALKIRVRTAFPGRRGEGGCFIPALSEESSDEAGVITTGTRDFVNAWVLAAAADIEATLPAPAEWGILSRTGRVAGPVPAAFHGGVLDATVDRRIRSQRRRRVRAALR